jgi:hypothetical protein
MQNRKPLSNAVQQFLVTSGLVCLFLLIIGGTLAIMLFARALLFALIYFYSAWFPLLMPISRLDASVKWTRDDGTLMETAVEVAIIHSDDTSYDYYRLAIREAVSRRRVKRRLIGCSATFLGTFDSGIWFYLHHGQHRLRSGLICLDTKTCDCLYHEPRSQIQLHDFLNQSGVMKVARKGVDMQLDLQTIPPIVDDECRLASHQ